MGKSSHTWYLSQTPQTCLSGVSIFPYLCISIPRKNWVHFIKNSNFSNFIKNWVHFIKNSDVISLVIDQSEPKMHWTIRYKALWKYICILGCFINDTLQKKRCNTSTHPSRVYTNQIWKNFFPKTSLEGPATWSKKATQGSLLVTKTYFLVGPDLCQVNF